MTLNNTLIVLCVILSVNIISEALVCPDTSVCQDGTTCCKWASGKYGCCPLALAQCCSDGLHCCPRGTKCDNKEGTCEQIPVKAKSKIIRRWNATVTNVVCPGGEQQCPDESTCCPMSGGEWGCCPLEGAVCCSDEIHCCPSGTTCGTSGCMSP